MNETRTQTGFGPSSFTRLGLSRTELAAAIAAELEQAEDGREPEAIASAVAAAIEANNEQVLRHLNQLFSSAGALPPAELSRPPADGR